MCDSVSFNKSWSLFLYISFFRFTVLFCNITATKYRFIYGRKAILPTPKQSDKGSLLILKKTPTKKLLFHLLFLLIFEILPIHPPYIVDAISKTKTNLECSKQVFLCKHYMVFFFSKK